MPLLHHSRRRGGLPNSASKEDLPGCVSGCFAISLSRILAPPAVMQEGHVAFLQWVSSSMLVAWRGGADTGHYFFAGSSCFSVAVGTGATALESSFFSSGLAAGASVLAAPDAGADFPPVSSRRSAR
jgi:hypothetical protein